MTDLEIFDIEVESGSDIYYADETHESAVNVSFKTKFKIDGSFLHTTKIAESKFRKIKTPEDIKSLLIPKITELSEYYFKEHKILEFNNYSKRNHMKFSYNMDVLYVADSL